MQIRLADGYEALKAFLPPRERRGIVFVDSSFDRAHEFDRLRRGLTEAHRRFATGIYALWYPLMEPGAMQAFERSIVATRIRKILQLELVVRNAGPTENLGGCGMLVVNPPYGFDAAARVMLEWLWPALSQNREGGQQVRWICPE